MRIEAEEEGFTERIGLDAESRSHLVGPARGVKRYYLLLVPVYMQFRNETRPRSDITIHGWGRAESGDY